MKLQKQIQELEERASEIHENILKMQDEGAENDELVIENEKWQAILGEITRLNQAL